MCNLPVSTSSSVLLCLVWGGVGVAVLAEETWEMLLWGGGAIGETSMVAVSHLVSASH